VYIKFYLYENLITKIKITLC